MTNQIPQTGGEYLNLGIKQAVREAIAEVLPSIINELEKRELKKTLPKQIKTSQAAKLLGISQNALNQRVFAGVYHENKHFKLVNGKIRLWDRDTLLKREQESETIQ